MMRFPKSGALAFAASLLVVFIAVLAIFQGSWQTGPRSLHFVQNQWQSVIPPRSVTDNRFQTSFASTKGPSVLIASLLATTPFPSNAMPATAATVQAHLPAWMNVMSQIQDHPLVAASGLMFLMAILYKFSKKMTIEDMPLLAGRLQQEAIKGIAATAVSATLVLASPTDMMNLNHNAALAGEEADIGKCVLARCQAQLAGCLADPRCVENLICIKQCSGRPDETECEIRCGDLYDSSSIQRFDTCAVSDAKCVPTKSDTGAYPPPPDEALVPAFDTNDLNGRWYITAGQNPTFDQFPCQEHFFTPSGPGKFFGKINWRVVKQDGRFLTRSAIQRFTQDPERPGILLNRNNEYLHYEDDWYVISWEPDTYILVYYRGRNDAWVGYGGCVLYTREDSVTPELETKYRPAWEEAVKKVGLDWNTFLYTDNSCPDQPEGVVDLDVILDSSADVVKGVGKSLASIKTGLGDEAKLAKQAAKGELDIFQQAIKDEFDFLRKQEKSIEDRLIRGRKRGDLWQRSIDEAERQAATNRLKSMEKEFERMDAEEEEEEVQRRG